MKSDFKNNRLKMISNSPNFIHFIDKFIKKKSKIEKLGSIEAKRLEGQNVGISDAGK